MRLDKFLDVVCVFKTRSAAAKAIKSGHLVVDGVIARASHEVRAGERLVIDDGLTRTELTVLEVPGGNVPRKDVSKYVRMDARTDEFA
jgi:ribosome-associated heat shock protein Hsp15